jgi:hypothetical protein
MSVGVCLPPSWVGVPGPLLTGLGLTGLVRAPRGHRPGCVITRGCRKSVPAHGELTTRVELPMENFTSPWHATHGERKKSCIPW